MTRVKICGITRLEDALAAAELGADALGFIFEESSPRYVGADPKALEIPRRLPPFVQKVAVYAHADNVRDYWTQYFDAIQFITNRWITGGLQKKQIRVLRLRGPEVLDELEEAQEGMDALLLDAYHPEKLGGAGVVADWDLARQVRERASLPVILAGGLTPENVAEAVEAVRPYGVDVSSGVERSPGEKDHAKLEAFISAVRRLDLRL